MNFEAGKFVSAYRRGPAFVVSITGELDLATAPEIGRAFVNYVGADAPVLLDLTQVSFLDSAGVRLLDFIVGDMDERGRAIRLIVGDAGPVRMTLQLCAFRDDLLAADLDKAAAELGA
ncbi:STAS domain-containing protein [Actinoplanes sp. NPDC049265]|uniref:STAS domain-containing protein n=1 Tax=Actinoplanes sp. NPDC049265 TaxID=3363902 RepID=UPI00371CEF52